MLGKGFDADDARELLLEHGDGARVLVVGHDPTFSQVVHDLTGARVDFKKGGVAAHAPAARRRRADRAAAPARARALAVPAEPGPPLAGA